MRLNAVITCIMLLAVAGISGSAEPEKVLLIAGKDSHGWGCHEHAAGCDLLAKALNESGLGIKASVHKETWPGDDAFKGLAAVVVYCDGEGAHMALGHEKQLAKLSKGGVGTAFIHYSLDATRPELQKCLLDCIGGFFEAGWSVNPTWTLKKAKLADHPVARGVKPFELKDEWYYHMRFRPEMKGVTPVLSALPPADSLAEEDGPRRGNPAVRKAIREGKPQHLAWASENASGSRGFGFTGGHIHANWANDGFRTLVLNGIAWTAGCEVPEKGIASKTPVIVTNKTILHAVAHNDVEDIRRYVKLGADVNELNRAGWAPIHYAAVRGKVEAAKVLIDAGANVNLKNKSKRTPLHDAAERNFLELARLLVKSGADLKAQEKDGWSPLHFAAVKGHIEMAKFLIEKGSDVNLQSAGGGTPLHEAAANAPAAMMKLLLDSGGDPSIKARNGKTALDFAVELGNKEVAELLKKKTK